MSDWKPIETAPKDECILGGYWSYDKDCVPVNNWEIFITYIDWKGEWYGDGYEGHGPIATHWQPLPADPSPDEVMP